LKQVKRAVPDWTGDPAALIASGDAPGPRMWLDESFQARLAPRKIIGRKDAIEIIRQTAPYSAKTRPWSVAAYCLVVDPLKGGRPGWCIFPFDDQLPAIAR